MGILTAFPVLSFTIPPESQVRKEADVICIAEVEPRKPSDCMRQLWTCTYKAQMWKIVTCQRSGILALSAPKAQAWPSRCCFDRFHRLYDTDLRP